MSIPRSPPPRKLKRDPSPLTQHTGFQTQTGGWAEVGGLWSRERLCGCLEGWARGGVSATRREEGIRPHPQLT
eukprot:3789847-Alexandrium_andersonii.AAC.1